MDFMETEFSCDTVKEANNFRGKISSIDKNVIVVNDYNGNEYTVHLGGCTKVETASRDDHVTVAKPKHDVP